MGNNKSSIHCIQDESKESDCIIQSNQNNATTIKQDGNQINVKNYMDYESSDCATEFVEHEKSDKLWRTKTHKIKQTLVSEGSRTSIHTKKHDKKGYKIKTDKSLDPDILKRLSHESDEKIRNINNLIEALDNFSKIFSQFPDDYNRTIKQIMSNFIWKNCEVNGTDEQIDSLYEMSNSHLDSISKIIPCLADHLASVQKMIVILSKSEEKIDTISQTIKSLRESHENIKESLSDKSNFKHNHSQNSFECNENVGRKKRIHKQRKLIFK